MILLDTCVVSEVARPRPHPAVLSWFEGVPEESLFLSALTLGDVKKGASALDPGPRRDRIDAWLEGLTRSFEDRVLPVDLAVALRWGELAAAGRRTGREPPPVDSLLAATALHHGLDLATRNTADFRVPGLRLIDPWSYQGAAPR